MRCLPGRRGAACVRETLYDDALCQSQACKSTTFVRVTLLKDQQHFIISYEGDTQIFSDKKLLKNILINLISNAIKFSGEGASIEFKANVDNRSAEISVIDHGIGISENDQEHLFTSFFRGRNAANIQGTGLGLHIIKRYVDLLNGEVHLQSELHKGTTITFIIPTKQP
jgi:signal transduction histidine kinase